MSKSELIREAAERVNAFDVVMKGGTGEFETIYPDQLEGSSYLDCYNSDMRTLGHYAASHLAGAAGAQEENIVLQTITCPGCQKAIEFPIGETVAMVFGSDGNQWHEHCHKVANPQPERAATHHCQRCDRPFPDAQLWDLKGNVAGGCKQTCAECAMGLYAEALKAAGGTAGATSFAWLIETAGPSYLATRKLGCHEFYWTKDHNAALRFYSREQADLTMEAVRESRPDLFPVCLPGGWRAVEHGWMRAAGGTQRQDS